MQPAGRDPQQPVAFFHLAGFKQPLPLNHPNHESGQVHLAVGVDLRHLRRFAADEGALRLAAAPSDAPHQGVQSLVVHAAESHVVEEEEGAGPLGENVVDVQGHQVAANGLEMPQLRRYLELGANPVGAGYQHRPAVAAQLEESGETAAAFNDLRPMGTGRQPPDTLLQLIHTAHVNADCR